MKLFTFKITSNANASKTSIIANQKKETSGSGAVVLVLILNIILHHFMRQIEWQLRDAYGARWANETQNGASLLIHSQDTESSKNSSGVLIMADRWHNILMFASPCARWLNRQLESLPVKHSAGEAFNVAADGRSSLPSVWSKARLLSR